MEPKIDWNNVGFEIKRTDYMYMMKCSNDHEFRQGQITPYANIELDPAAGVLNYGQGLLEGMKAYRREDGKIVLFRPDQNALRMKVGAERMCMPCPSVDQFVDAVKQTALANDRWIPPAGKGSLYLRPLILGTGPILALTQAPEYTFLIYTTPVGNFLKEGVNSYFNLYIEEKYHRASRGGTGGIKSITNYGPALKPLTKARSNGFSEVLYLDSESRKYVEEVSGCNIFVVKNNIISTPPINGTVLPGVTRKSIIEIARDHGYQVEERLIEVKELLEADEAFCTGTAVVVVPVGSITYQDKRVEFQKDNDSVSKKLLATYVAIINGHTKDEKGWISVIN
ncbi:hypothetical protein RND81_11G102100 [Saponaria officinalis]|uniref:Branched-chain-amino-acid aminotransferase n=1 Tax=Saponaria officinalis TaxID=3572 RepID=A0AAW1HKJ5_SAPOF